MHDTRCWPAPAKLNLFLHINGLRADGYHELQTLFQFIDCCDRLYFTDNDSGELTLDVCPSVDFPAEQNLVLRAAYRLKNHCQISRGMHIRLEKQIPMGGGLGGGSSDAATTLLALNQIWQCNLRRTELAELGRQLGADVPVFVHGHAAFAEGIGERLTVAQPSEPWYLVITPDCHVTTGAVFSDPALIRDTPKMSGDLYDERQWKNDCQPLVAQKYPEVANALSWLLEYAPSRMTGTGACVFASFASEADARQVLAFAPDGIDGFVARGVNLSPLEGVLQEISG